MSYYAKGSLVALAFDLTLRKEGKATLDDVMRLLWQRSRGGPIGEDDIADALKRVGGRSYAKEIAAWVHGTAELPLTALLEVAGVALSTEKAGYAAALGLRLAEGTSGVQVKQVLAGSAAMRAGVSAADELLAVDGWRIRRLDEAQQWLVPGRDFELLLVRDQRLMHVTLQPGSATAAPQVALALTSKASARVSALRRGWIGA